jgi:hypothetical protein
MMKARTLSALAAIACASAAQAQEQALPRGAWATSDDRITLTAAGISLPRDLGPVSLSSTGEFSRKGEGVDNFAQFSNEDKSIQATAYIYLPAYADAALTAFMTDRAIFSRFGAETKRVETRSVDIAGHPGAAIRVIYVLPKGDPSTAAFARVDGWIVKLRVTSFGADKADATAAILDRMIAGLRVGADAVVLPAAPLVVSDCPAPIAKPAKLLKIKGKDAGTSALAATLMGGSVVAAKKKADAPVEPALVAFPKNGADPACLRGTIQIGENNIPVLQPAGEAEPDILLAPVNDAGLMATSERALIGKGYVTKLYSVAQADTLGTFETLPTEAQITAILKGEDNEGGARVSRVVMKANGNTEINLNSDMFK